MKRSALTLFSLSLFALSTAMAVDPVSFQELSLLLRTGENQQSIYNEVEHRKLLQPLTAAQEAALRAAGASPSLLTALHAPQLLASPDAVALYRSNHQAPPAGAPPVATQTATPPTALPAQRPVNLPDRFTAGLESAKRAPIGPVHRTDAFDLGHLEAAKAKAQREHKPLGFVMVWDNFFETRASTRNYGGSNALLHFYQAFKDSVVLVFVHHENELDKVPRAVAMGFQGPDEGGWAPNMAVVDATASEFIIEIPCAGPKGPGSVRDDVFKNAAAKIQAWLSTHPDAMAAPAR